MEKRGNHTIDTFDLNTDPAHEQEQEMITGKINSKTFSFITLFILEKIQTGNTFISYST